ncbi:hypothetical protein ELI41_00515 [Rhizobium leguminosarum]|uniref:Uncharacterized protein n=1 Tax=Rhizobium leguminosarum TaxID=384 RepID=A0A4Q8XUD0_RHILE|nr:hypothetical protein ELI41_00515 [Rhizobium leguminosarum]TAV51707.1 hypothetical protein ELI29_00515 [Rhizobium leguminosarum]TAV87810.1 hypothetical protein ELI22_00520 [Rhizobium leguminosarum]TAV92393.1 hypothetical protein ELI21_00520 [Rhizobium leguminosarum]TAW33464.1 hypothetical protein ELI23_00520 [Rhizobium leguminosarum]
MSMFPLIPVITALSSELGRPICASVAAAHSADPHDGRIITMAGIAFDQGRHSRSKASPKALASVPPLFNRLRPLHRFQ